MPLIILSGYPSSGLTYRAQQIITYFKEQPPSSSPSFRIEHISDDTLSIPRSAYDVARTEKDARAALSSAVKRHLGRETLVVCDAMNYIKGFRYQMWCEAKAAGTSCCVVSAYLGFEKALTIKVHVAVSPEQARTLHQQRIPNAEGSTPEDSKPEPTKQQALTPAYNLSTFENLIMRYEEPSSAARWDSPLFVLPYSDADPPYEAIRTALFSNAKPTKSKKGFTPAASASQEASTPATQKQKQVVRPHLATVAPKAMSSDALYVLEHATSAVVKTIQEYLVLSGGMECSGETIRIEPGDGETTNETTMVSGAANDDETGPSEDVLQLRLPTTGTLSVAQLQRLKRQFVSLYRSRGVGMGAASSAGRGALGTGSLLEDRVTEAFVGFLQQAFEGVE